jgi:hypothetical protein
MVGGSAKRNIGTEVAGCARDRGKRSAERSPPTYGARPYSSSGMSSMTAIGAPSPLRCPSLRMRV